MFLNGYLILLAICLVNRSQAQQYILDPRFHFQAPQDDFYNQNKGIPFPEPFRGFSNFDPYIPHRDLQTSDIPYHLQKTLPQYRISSKEQIPKNEFPYNNLIFRTGHENAPDIVAPSTHRPNYSHFLSQNHNRNPSQTETFLGQITLDNSFGNIENNYYNIGNDRKVAQSRPIPDKLLREHTRILAPDPEENQNKLKENKYFVNENGEVFSTTLAPLNVFTSKKLSTKLQIEGVNQNAQDLPRNINYNDKTLKTSKSLDQDFNSANNFELTDYEYDDEAIQTQMKSHNLINPPKKPESVKSITDHAAKHQEIISSTMKSNGDNDSMKTADKKLPDEPVVSVVTTKSVINNTIIATTTPSLLTTESMDTTTLASIENTTDSWVVVASVQTSKSISGAHYLPSSIVAQEERFTLLNEKEGQEKLSESLTTTGDYSSYEDYGESTTEESTTQLTLKHSTESLIDKLDRVQSDLSSGLLAGGFKNEDNNIAVITENMTDKMHLPVMSEQSTTSLPTPKSHFPIIKKFSANARPPTSNLYPKRKTFPHKKIITSTTTQSSIEEDLVTTKAEPKIIIAKPDAYLPPGYKPPAEKDNSSELLTEILKKFKASSETEKKVENRINQNETLNTSIDAPLHRFGSHNATPNNKNKIKNDSEPPKVKIEDLLKVAKPVNVESFLPPDYKKEGADVSSVKIGSILKTSVLDDVSAFLPPGYKSKTYESKIKHPKESSLSESSSETSSQEATEKPSISIDAILNKSKKDDLSALLPPGYIENVSSTTKKPSKIDDILQNSKEDDISAFLPPGYRTKSASTTNRTKSVSSTTKTRSNTDELFENSKKDDISAFLPPGYKSKSFTTRKPVSKSNIEVENLPTSLLPSGYKPRKEFGIVETSTEILSTSTISSPISTSKQGLKVVFPSRPGGKRINHKITTPKPRDERKEVTQAAVPTIHKGWPSRATTEFTGWPTPSTTPISIEKLLESVQKSSPSTEETENVIFTSTAPTTVTSTTTTVRPTTPGVCVEECDLVGTIKLVDGVKWVPELLDRNTKEWQLLANEVQTQLEEVYTKSEKLGTLFKNLRIDGFSEGSVLVDYLVEMNNANMHVSTLQMKKLFNEALRRSPVKAKLREGKSLNETEHNENMAQLGKFIIDPNFTDFIVIPKGMAPTVGYAEDNLLLPQWAIAVIVIGLASLLFVIIFGVTVLVNRSKNSKKKIPTPLTEDMLNELNKNHMGGYDNYGVEDPYSLEAGFWDPKRMEAHREYSKLPKKGSSGSIHDNSMTNLYDSWKSQWNGYYSHSTGGYYGHQAPSSSHRLYERRRSYDTNF